MTTEDLPLRGPAIYNPHLLSRKELTDLFQARQPLLRELLDDLRRTPPEGVPQHQLIVGVRGMGKTMLLRRFQAAIEDDPELSRIWLPLTFPEEQYNVANLADFWLNCLDALSDSLESRGDLEALRNLDQQVDAIRSLPRIDRARQALELLEAFGNRQGRRLVLLVDNADLIFDRIGDEQWVLRETLSNPGGVAFVGASSVVVESTYQYGKSFYDFFRVHELLGLGLEETGTLLLHYARTRGDSTVERIVEEDPGRIKALHNLTGGNPRTLALLYTVLATGPFGGVRSDLEQLLDLCTPLYKARFEEMSAQAQQIVHALALRWDPATAADLAQDTGLDINTISGQINRLARQGMVEKVPYDPESKTGFQVAERFFNTWYLMRASRRVRRRLLWLVEFLRVFYSEPEAQQPLDPEDTWDRGTGSLATFGAGESALEQARAAFVKLESSSDGAHLRSILSFCGELVAGGREPLAARLLGELDCCERWRPLREALEVRIRGNRAYLKRIAPEVRRPTIEILDQLDACASQQPAAAAQAGSRVLGQR